LQNNHSISQETPPVFMRRCFYVNSRIEEVSQSAVLFALFCPTARLLSGSVLFNNGNEIFS